jgi:outer membrane receptor protein involved in Fe transport
MRRIAVVVVTLLALLLSLNAFAQSSTATIRGKVTNESGTAISNAEINAVSTSTGFVHTVNAGSSGSYVLGGLTPGTFNLVVAAPGYEPKSQDLTVLVGQTLDVNLRLTPTAVLTESITVVGNQLVDTRAPEVATNVTVEQIEHLPQPDRNFLNFAALAPGVRISLDQERKTFSSGGASAEQVNVFIDGVSFKNDVLQGGVVGQDSSKGNPFPQNAVQEFRVITQNYGAQYEKASSAIITAVTKSGGNQFDGDAFIYYQNKDWVARDFFTPATTAKPDYKRNQYGLSLGGPIVRDRINFFASFEGNDQDRTRRVFLSNPNFANRFGQFEGTFTSPFRSKLAFGKVSLQPTKDQLIDWSANYRHETDIKDFGDQASYQSARNVKNDVSGTTLRHQWTGNVTLNQASLSYEDYKWNPVAIGDAGVGLNYQGIIRIGGTDTVQKFGQKRFELRDDYTYAGLNAYGTHTIQAGGVADLLKYTAQKQQFGNPLYEFRQDISLEFPFQALYGVGDGDLSLNNREFGIYGQDSWVVNPNLSLNLGVRWDYETNMINNDYVTPPAVVQAFTGKIPSKYFSTGNNRKPYKSAFQPRFGFSYDLSANGRSVVFGGAGRYFDRLYFNATFDEAYRVQYAIRTFRFSANGEPRDGSPTIKWDPSYLTAAGLNQLIAQGTAPSPEVFFLGDDVKPPHSDQWTLGFRQSLGSTVASVSYAAIRGKNGFTYILVNRNAQGRCCVNLVPGYGNVWVSDPTKRNWFDGIYLTLDRPMTSWWGYHLAYTRGKATQTGGADTISFDYPTVAAYPRYPTATDERNRLVFTGMIHAPWDIRFSTLITLGSGVPYNVFDASRGFDPPEFQLKLNGGKPAKQDFIIPDAWAYRSVDLRGEKDFNVVGRSRVGVTFEAFNVFNYHNFGCFEGFIARLPEINPRFGQPNCQVDPGRRFQVGLRVGL